MNKNITLVIVAALIVGSIIYLERSSPPRLSVTPGAADIPLLTGSNATTTLASSTCDMGVCTSTVAATGTPPKGIAVAGNVKSSVSAGYMTLDQKIGKYPRAKEIVSPSGFINTPPFKIADLIGKKVILIDFWTYSCINCQRTLPYINAWYAKYKDRGFEVVSVHTPEFDFEKIKSNVEASAQKYGVKYPIVMDNDYGTWSAYQNNYWPRKYLIDIDGFITFDHIGEGGYQETEKKIQDTLNERFARLGSSERVTDALSTDAEVKAQSVIPVGISPETYFGAARFVASQGLKLSANWKIAQEYAESTGDATISYTYTAQHMYMVAESPTPQDIEIYSDGVFVKKLTVSGASLYTLIDSSDMKPHVIEIKIPKAGLKAYTFTFG